MNFKYWLLVCILGLGIVFLGLDKCGSSRRADELRGQYEEAREIAEVERRIQEATIREQQEKIAEAMSTIAKINENVAKKDRNIAELGNTITDLEEEFGNLPDKDEKIDNLTKQVNLWKEKFTLSQSIIQDKDEIIFQLSKKYKSQLKISNSYKDMYESVQGVLVIRGNQVKELEKINKRLRLTSGLKSGLAVMLAGLIVYNMIK